MDDVNRPLRVLHCPSNVGSNPQGLARAERELGLESHAVAFRSHRFQTPPDEILWQESDGRIRCEVKRWQLLRRAIRDFDVVHFNFGCTILPERMPWNGPWMQRQNLATRLLHMVYAGLCEQRDLKWLKRAGVGIVVTYQGDDARQGNVCREKFEITSVNELGDEYLSPDDDELKRKRIAIVERFADQVYALNPDLLHVLPSDARFMAYSSVAAKEISPTFPDSQIDIPVLMHAPTFRGGKGTQHILSAVDRLRSADNLEFRFELIEGLSHSEAMRAYRRADLVIDQLWAGWYGAFAVEVMALGKPVVCYIRDEDLGFIPSGMRNDLPFINATPWSIYDVLKEWLTSRRSELATRGRCSRHYVERWHDPHSIATELQQRYEQITSIESKQRSRLAG